MRVSSEDVCLRSLLSQESTRQLIKGAIRQYSAARGHRLRAEDVEDVAQVTLLRLWRAAKRISPESPRAYIRQSARNAVTDLFRYENAAKRGYGERARPADLEQTAADDPSIEESLLTKEALEERLAVLRNALSPRAMTVLRLVFGAGLTSSEAAARLNVSVASIDSIVFRARDRLAARCGVSLRSRCDSSEGGNAPKRASSR